MFTSREIEPFIKPIFDHFTMYYPIDFEPPKNDNFRITPEELKDGLNRCFIANPEFAQYGFTYIFSEKLSSQSASTKIQSLKTLTWMIDYYPVDKVL